MKKRSLIVCVLFLVGVSLFAQSTTAPEKQIMIGPGRLPSAPPLIILDAEVIDNAKLSGLDPDEFFSVSIIKEEKNTEYANTIHREKARNGVVKITTKNEAARQWLMQHSSFDRKCKKMAQSEDFNYSSCQVYLNGEVIGFPRELLDALEEQKILNVKCKKPIDRTFNVRIFVLATHN